MKISQLSKLTGVSVRSIRYYEKKNLITATRLENGYREFDEAAIDRIKIIQIYLGLGLTTDQISGILNCHDNYVYPNFEYLCEETLEVYEERLNEVNRNIDTLITVKKRLKKQIDQIKRSDSQREF